MILDIKQSNNIIPSLSSTPQSLSQDKIEIVRLFCMGYNNLNNLQINNIDINDIKYIECLKFMKNNKLPNDIKLPIQFHSFIKKVNIKHNILVKENQIKIFYKQMNEIQNNNNKFLNNSNSKIIMELSNKYQQLFLAIQMYKKEIQSLNQELLKL